MSASLNGEKVNRPGLKGKGRTRDSRNRKQQELKINNLLGLRSQNNTKKPPWAISKTKITMKLQDLTDFYFFYLQLPQILSMNYLQIN